MHENDTHSVVLTDIYKMHSKYSNTVRRNDVLTWKSNNFTASRISKYNQRKNMTGSMMKAAIVVIRLNYFKIGCSRQGIAQWENFLLKHRFLIDIHYTIIY